jgi:polysaccharide export outer membrane protein
MTSKVSGLTSFSALLALIASAALAQVPAAQTVSPPPSGPALDAASSAYVLGRDDVVEVSLLGGGTFGGRARVQADGTIQLPFIGKVAAADKTTAELSEAVRKALQTGGFFADPVVVVEVVGFASRYVVVLGQFGAPGLVPINRPYRLSEIVARSGGVRDTGTDYIVVTAASGEEKRYKVDDLAQGSLDKDPYVKPGDKIFVPPAETYYIYGKVNGSGAFTMRGEISVRMAIARAGGLAEGGSDKKIDATRDGKKVKLGLDDKIKPGDVLVVGEKLF